MHRSCGAILQGVAVYQWPHLQRKIALPPSLFTYIYLYFSLNFNRITFYNIFLIIVVLCTFILAHICGVWMCVALPVCILSLLNADFTSLDKQASKLVLKVPSLPSVCWEHSWESLQSSIYSGYSPDFSPLACVALSSHSALSSTHTF